MLDVVQVPVEPPPCHLGDGRHVIGAAVACGVPDRVVAVVRLARQPVLEHHERRHHIGALHMADVDTLDAQRRIG